MGNSAFSPVFGKGCFALDLLFFKSQNKCHGEGCFWIYRISSFFYKVFYSF